MQNTAYTVITLNIFTGHFYIFFSFFFLFCLCQVCCDVEKNGTTGIDNDACQFCFWGKKETSVNNGRSIE